MKCSCCAGSGMFTMIFTTGFLFNVHCLYSSKTELIEEKLNSYCTPLTAAASSISEAEAEVKNNSRRPRRS